MELINHTAFPHLLFRTGLEEKKFAAAIMLRVTYDVKDGEAVISPKQVWPINAGAWESDYGTMPGDFVFKRGGIDVMVFGSAISPNKQPVKQMEVRLSLAGKIEHKLKVFGNRVWQSGFLGMGISEPEYFSEMPVTMANAFGGWDDWDELKFPYSSNPFGKGFVWEKSKAIGRPLPNIEDPRHPITKWNDRPDPVGFTAAPMSEKKAKMATEFDADGNLVKFDPIFYNAAFPELIIKELKPGEEFIVEGMTVSKNFRFRVPDHQLSANLLFDEKLNTRYLSIDQVGLEPNIGRAFITYRYAFNYTLKPLTKRSLEIFG
jgi:hypothetical protein